MTSALTLWQIIVTLCHKSTVWDEVSFLSSLAAFCRKTGPEAKPKAFVAKPEPARVAQHKTPPRPTAGFQGSYAPSRPRILLRLIFDRQPGG